MKAGYLIGVDIGGTKIAITLGTMNGEILKKVKFPTDKSYKISIDMICQNIENIISDLNRTAIKAIGISCGGPLNSQTGIICSPPNLPGWDDIPVCQMLHNKTAIPCFLENDANACALAEWIWGAGRGTRNMIFLTFGTGLGAGLILNGNLYSGTTGMAGEAGHIRLADKGPDGYGKKGSWEGFCSGGGISRHYLKLYGKEKSAKDICSLANEGDAKALEVINSAAHYLGRGVAVLLDILNPQKVIIGSIYSRDEALFREKMEQVIAQEALISTAGDCRIETAALGESLGDMAALGVAMNGLKRIDRYGRNKMGCTKIMVNYIDDLINRYPALSESRSDIEDAAKLLTESAEAGGKFLICGNGGSSADADHIVGELMKGFVHSRPLSQEQKEALERIGGEKGLQMGAFLQQGIPAISLSTPTALNTAFLNDVDPSLIFAQQVMGLGSKGDVLWALSTSGNSSNIVSAAIAAKAMGLRTFAMTGEKESQLSGICDVCIQVKGSETYKIQELHLPIYHTLCLIIEDYFFINYNQ